MSRIRRLLPVAVALALVAVMSSTAPDWEDEPPRDWTSLTVGERGELRDFALTVTSVAVTDTVALRESTLASTGVFVVVGVQADALLDPVQFSRVRLVLRSGRRYEARAEWPTAGLPLTQAGFTSRGTWVFEIPRADVGGARLEVGNEPREFDAYDGALRIDLGLSSAVPQPGPLQLPDATTWVTR